jgi:AsmA protein
MRRAVRVVLVVVVLLVVAAAALPFVISVDRFRPTIEQKASAALGRPVHIGKLGLSIFKGQLSAEDLAVGEDPAFGSSPFLTAKSLRVGVEMLPLILSRTLNVTGITIDTPEVTLIRTPAGRWNFSSLSGGGRSSGSSQAPDFTIRKLELVNGRVALARKGSEKRSTYEHVTITASDVSPRSSFPLTVGADLPSGGKLALDGRAGPLDPTDASMTPVAAKLSIKSLNLAAMGLLDASAGLGGILDLDGAFESRGGEATAKGTATLARAVLVAGGTPVGVPITVNFDTKYNLGNSVGVLNPSVLAIGKAAARLSGTYNTAAETTLVQLRMHASDMPVGDLQAFLPALNLTVPKGATLQAGTLNADLQATGPVDRLVTSGTITLAGAKLAGFDLGSKLSAIASLAGFKSGKDLDIEKLAATLRVAPNGIEASDFLAIVPGLGSLTGAGTVDAKNGLDFRMIANLTRSAPSSQAQAPAPPAEPAGTAAQPAPTGKLAGLLSGLRSGGLKSAVTKATGSACQGGVTVPFQIKGTTSDPKFVPDVGGLAAATLKSKLGCLTP